MGLLDFILIQAERTYIVHFLTEFSQIHGMLVKISNVPSVRIDHKLLSILYLKQKKFEYWEDGGEITKLK